jgi:hypothetical protein
MCPLPAAPQRTCAAARRHATSPCARRAGGRHPQRTCNRHARKCAPNHNSARPHTHTRTTHLGLLEVLQEAQLLRHQHQQRAPAAVTPARGAANLWVRLNVCVTRHTHTHSWRADRMFDRVVDRMVDHTGGGGHRAKGATPSGIAWTHACSHTCTCVCVCVHVRVRARSTQL